MALPLTSTYIRKFFSVTYETGSIFFKKKQFSISYAFKKGQGKNG